MKYFPSFILSLGFAALAFAAPARLMAADFPQDESDLRADPNVRFGQLPNGVSYMILPNHVPEDHASFRLVVGAGSFDETDDQQGLAHFLAHMAFRGSTHYPPGTLGQTLERWGMSSDPEDNSETDFDHTTYMLELPDTRAATLKEGCRIFSDFAGGLLLRDDLIEAERPTILAEKLDRASNAYSEGIAEMKFTLPDTLIPNRLPIGLGDVIEHAQRAHFVDFYDTWYRPERITVIAVGDFDANDMEAMIRDAFTDLKDRAPARPAPKLGDIPIASGLKVKYFHEPGRPTVRISIETITPSFPEADTAERRTDYLRRGLAFAMLNRRLANVAQRADVPFLKANADVGEQFDFVHNASLELVCKRDHWRIGLQAGEQELRRAIEYGFQPVELREVVAAMRRSLEQALGSASSRPSQRLADSLVRSLVRKQVFTSPAENLAVYSSALDRVTAEGCTDALREAWASKGTYLVVAGDLGDTQGDELVAAYTESKATAVEPLPKIVEEVFPYTDFGAPGAVTSRTEVADLGITEVVFANGVRLNLKSTKYEPGKVEVSVRVGGGTLTEPADAEPGLARFTEGVFTSAGLGKLSVGDIGRSLAGRTAGVDFRVGDDAFILGGATDPMDLSLELQLITAYITDPGYRPEALQRARRAIPKMYDNLNQIPDGLLATKIARVMVNGNPRFGVPLESDLMARNLDEMKAWLAPQLAHSYIEVGVVGDFDTAAAIDAVARTLGALAKRDARPDYAAERVVSFPEKPLTEVYPSPKGVWKSSIIMIWPTTDGRDSGMTHRLGLLAAIFEDSLREKILDTPKDSPPPVARSNSSTTFAGYGSITVDATADPGKAIDTARTVLTIAAQMAKNGVTKEQFDRAKQSAIVAVNESALTNDYWLNSVLAQAQERPEHLDWARKRYDDVNNISQTDMDDFAEKFLNPTRVSRFLVTPEQAPEQPAQ